MRNLVRCAGAALALLAWLPAGPAASQGLSKYLPGGGGRGSPELWKLCEGQDGVTPEKQIEGCNFVIDGGGEDDVNVAGAYTNRGNAYRDSGELDRAVQDYNKAITMAPKLSSAYLGRGGVFVAKGQLDFALLDFDKVTKLEPKAIDGYINRGTVY
jgi:tetratricopeptide (TPR) repeat protein